MRGADIGQVDTGLGPCGGVGGVGVYHTADFGKRAVERQMGGSVGGRTERAFDHRTVGQAHHHHVGSLHGVVAYAAGLDDHETFLAVDARYIAPGENHQAVLNQAHVGTKYFFFKFFEHYILNRRLLVYMVLSKR